MEIRNWIGGIAVKKRRIVLILAVLLVVSVAAFGPKRQTMRDKVIARYQENEAIFLQAAASGDYQPVENLKGVGEASHEKDHVDIYCGGAGFGASTHYYGIFYSTEDDLCAVSLAGPREELVAEGDGFLYQQAGGDNRYYVESLGNHFYYYEAHF